MERFIALVERGVGPEYWLALARRGQAGHQALQHMSLLTDPETRFRIELAYARRDRFIVERYLALMRTMPPSPETADDTRFDRWTNALADWSVDAEKSATELEHRVGAKWAMLLRDCRAEQFMPYALAQFWDDADGLDVRAVMEIRALILRWREVDELPDDAAREQLAALRELVGLYAKAALGGLPKATWTRRATGIVVRNPAYEEAVTLSPSDPWALFRDLCIVAMEVRADVYGSAYNLWGFLIDDVHEEGMWLTQGRLEIADTARHLASAVAKVKRFHARPALCPLHAEAFVEREMRDLDNDPEGCWTATLAGMLVALAGEALTRPGAWYTERDLRDHVERCHTSRTWRPALWDLWKRLDGVVHTDAPVGRRRRAIAESERLFARETERLARKAR